MTLRVRAPGLHTLRVDFGRPSSRSLGVPLGGAADRTSLILGNTLLGNAPDASTLEITLTGPTIEAEDDTACVLYGAPFEAHIGARPLPPGVTFTLPAGEALHIGGTARGMRAYLCVAGGFSGQAVLGSQTALEPLHIGDILSCPPSSVSTYFIRPHWSWEAGPRLLKEVLGPAAPTLLRVLDGPQADWFQLADFYGAPDDLLPPAFTMSRSSNRMGLRLQGPALRVPARELVSEPVCPGAVQVTRDGQCILLGVDGQTIGGYPKIAQVISADLDCLGQLRPDEDVGFLRVTLEQAERLHRHKREELAAWLVRLRAVAPPVQVHRESGSAAG